MLNPAPAARRALPSVDRLLQLEPVCGLITQFGRPLVATVIRDELDACRERLLKTGDSTAPAFNETAFVAACAARLERRMRPSLQAVFNLTGTVLHTNLGRAIMPQCAAEAAMRAMTRPVNLEFDLERGARGERDVHIERWLTGLTGAEGAVVVNNNAAAVYLVLNALAAKKEVLVSRGELIEIGGAFRIPDIMARAGCRLREVGTTNRTHLSDYAGALTERTGAIMKVHTSNYQVQGFTAAVAEDDLAALARGHKLPFIVDLGCGMLVNLEDYGLPHEPTPREALAHGADIVTFSGDKLLGGPQSGLIVGRADLIARIRKNPMKRALRVDKMTLAALEAVLQLYANPDRLQRELPTLRWLTRAQAAIRSQAMRLLPRMEAALAGRARATIADCSSQIGSGSLPVDSLPSAGVALVAASGRKGSGLEKIAAGFRALPTPVIGRITDGAFLMDLRCLDPEDEDAFCQQLGGLRI